MNTIGCFSRLSKLQPSTATTQHLAGYVGIAILGMMASVAIAQNPTPAAPLPKAETQVSAPEGYVIHQSADLGGHLNGLAGSKAMYSTLVNQSSGMRVLGETFELHALPGTKAAFVDSISAVGSGFGGDPYEFARLAASKGRDYEFTGLFRRDRQYFDYDLLANPNINPGFVRPEFPLAITCFS